MPGGTQGCVDAFADGWRDHHEAQPYGGEQHLGECPDIDHATGDIEALKRWNGMALEAVFTVIVILDDPGVPALGDADKIEALFHGHGDAQRMMAARRRVDEARHRRRGIEIPAAILDPQRRQSCASRKKCRGSAIIAGLLHPHGIAGVEQHARQEIESRLRTVGDDDLLGGAVHAARHGDIARDGIAERRIALHMVGPEQLVTCQLGAARC